MRAVLTTLADVLGAGAVCAGVAFIFWPAAVILAGLILLVASFLQADQ